MGRGLAGLAALVAAPCVLLLAPSCARAAADARHGAHAEAQAEEDAVALLQQSARARASKSADVGADKYAELARLAGASPHSASFSDSPLAVPPALYCRAFPHFCEEPFNCQTVTQEERDEWSKHGDAVAVGGKPNLRTWCFEPQFMPYMSRCAAGDISGAGKLQYDLTATGLYGPTTMEMDGSYCFLEGHCVNEDVTNDTTVEDTIAMCDKRFGSREAWATFGRADAPPEDLPGWGFDDIPDRKSGFLNRTQVRPFVLATCAMGNYHCDVLYCRENYCKNPYYVNKYGHYLKEYGHVK